MALFIASLALGAPLPAQARVGILAASLTAATFGMTILWTVASNSTSQPK